METRDPSAILEKAVFAALESYSNVHRGSGHKSILSTQLFEQARRVILKQMGRNPRSHLVIFATPGGVDLLAKQIKGKDLLIASSSDIWLPLGVKALVIRKKSLPAGILFRSGGGTTKLISREWVIWAKAPAKYEAGTPPVINIIAFARALQIAGEYGKDCFKQAEVSGLDVKEILYLDGLREYHGKELLEKLREKRVGKGFMVPTLAGPLPAVNLDNSASTPTFTPIWDAFRRTLFQPEDMRKRIVTEVRTICAAFLGAPLSEFEIIFTSNTTESINMVAENINTEDATGDSPVIVSSLLEHSSNDLPWRTVSGRSLHRISVDPDGFFDVVALEKLLQEYNRDKKYGGKKIDLVALSGASNVLGTCNRLELISDLVHRYGARFLVDGAQLIAHRKIDMSASGIDFLAFSAHKAYAPFGCGVLAARKGSLGVSMDQPGFTAGSEENTAGIAALGKALELLGRIGMDTIENEEQELTAKALQHLSGLKDLQLYGISDPESPEFTRKLGVISFNLKNVVSFRVGKELAFRQGVGLRVGCHCAHITVKHILNVGAGLEKFQKVMQTLIPSMSFPGVARVSLGIENSEADLERLIAGLRHIARRKNTPVNQTMQSGIAGSETITRSEFKEQLKEYYNERAKLVFNNI